MSALNTPGLSPLAATPHDVRFHLLAEAEPGLLPRLLVPFARRDLLPDRVSALRQGEVMRVEIAVDAMPGEMVHLVEGNLRQVVGVHGVRSECAPRGMAAAA